MHHHLTSVIVVNLAAAGFYLSGINEGLTFLSLCLAISYTAYRFYKDYTKKIDKPNHDMDN